MCHVLTVLKHKNTIICLQIFKKHAKFTYLFLRKTMLQSVILFQNVRSVSECVFLFWSVTPPTASLPNNILTARVSSGKHSVLQPLKPANKLGHRSQILPELKSLSIHLKSSVNRGLLTRINQLISLHCKARWLKLSVALIPCCIWQPA